MIYSEYFRDAQFYSKGICGFANVKAVDGGDEVRISIPIQGADGTNDFILDLKEYQVDSLIKSLVKAKSLYTGTDRMVDSEFNHKKIEAWLEPNY